MLSPFLLEYQVIESLKNKVQALAETRPSPPIANTNRRKRKKEAKRTEPEDSDLGSDSDDDKPISALKKPLSSSKAKPGGIWKKSALKSVDRSSSKQVSKTTPTESSLLAKSTAKKAPKPAAVTKTVSSTSSSKSKRQSPSTEPRTSSASIELRPDAAQNTSKNISADTWKSLKSKGWRYVTGPVSITGHTIKTSRNHAHRNPFFQEPHNKVYVPADGATHPGTQLGIHFFNSDQVIEAATQRGDLNCDKSGPRQSQDKHAVTFDARMHVSSRSPTEGPAEHAIVRPGSASNRVGPKGVAAVKASSRDKNEQVQSPRGSRDSDQNEDQLLDDTRLLSKSVTLESARVCIKLVASFLEDDGGDFFVGRLFQPLWSRLKEQGGDGKSWQYGKYSSPLSSKSWAFIPPGSKGIKGRVGEDFFLEETAVTLQVLTAISHLKEREISSIYDRHRSSLDTVMATLKRAVDGCMSYSDAKLGKSPSQRSRRAKSQYLPGEDTASDSGKPPSRKRGASKITPEVDVRAKASTTKGPGSVSSESASSASTKRASNLSSSKKQRLNRVEDVSPSFHMDQTQQVAPPTSFRRSPVAKNGPLAGISFFYSGIDSSFKIEDKIRRLGGNVLSNVAKLTHEEVSNQQVFFISDPTSWRKPKYIAAASQGAPMVHYNWLVDMKKKYVQDGQVKAFDSELYTRYKLPIGLDLSKGYFVLQRASNAKHWNRPGCVKGKGRPIFDNMTIALAIENGPTEQWAPILRACGATVVTISDLQKSPNNLTLDCCLFNAITLPPHSISLPVNVSQVIKRVAKDVPFLDLAWAHQSIIQRKRLNYDDPRYTVSNQISGKSDTVFAIRHKTQNVRYEVGDLVQFSRGTKSTSHGRIADILRSGRSCKLEIQLLVSRKHVSVSRVSKHSRPSCVFCHCHRTLMEASI